MLSTWKARRALAAYVGLVVVIGAGAIVQALYDLHQASVSRDWLILAALTLLTGSITVRIPAVQAKLSVSEAFVFTCVLLYGPSAGTITAALDGLISSLWLRRKGHPIYRVLFNTADTAAALWLSAHLFVLVKPETLSLRTAVVPLIAFTLTYFLLNTWSIAIAIALEEHVSAFRTWRDNFLWLSLNYFSGASVAALLVVYSRQFELTALWIIVPILVISYLTYKTAMGRVDDANKHLAQLNTLYLSTIETLAMAIDAKDQITHGHIRRVQDYAVGLARTLGVTDDAQIRAIEASALLHDMGKLAVPDYILNKPGPLTPAEYERIKLHASAGADILSSIEFPFPVVPIVRHHHENWDGTGYPDGLKGTDIPLGARILSVVDCFDALTSDRPYRPRFSDGTALEIVLQRRGVMYDPVVVDAFVRVFNQLVPRPPTGASDQRAPFLTTTSAGLSPTPASEHTSARLEEIAASSEETLTLFEISRGLAVSMSVSDALGVIAKHLRRVVPSTFCVLYLYDASADELVVGNAVGDTAGVFSGLRIPLGQRLTGWVAANRQTILNSDPMLDLGETARALEPPLRSAISTPLVTTNALVGVLTLYSSNRSAFSDDHRRILETIARQLSLVIAAAHDVDRGRSLLTRDDPGRLPGIDSLRAIAALVTDDDGKFEQACSVLCLDVSGVTELTRCAGRQAADQALAGIVSAIRRVLRSEDRLFRHRTGELVVFLPRTGLRTAQVIAERLGSRISQPGAVPVTRGTTLSVGTGVASAPDDAVVLDELIDQARLRAVSSKENRVRLGDSPTSVH